MLIFATRLKPLLRLGLVVTPAVSVGCSDDARSAAFDSQPSSGAETSEPEHPTTVDHESASTGSLPPTPDGTSSAETGGGPEDPPPSSAWRNVVVGGGGFVTGIVHHSSDEIVTYARTDVGGAYRYDGALKRWNPITDMLARDQADSMGVLSIATDPSDAEAVYLMTGKYTADWAGFGFLLASQDRGETWTRVQLPVKVGGNENGRGTGERLAVDPNLGTRLLMGTTQAGLWSSLDRGMTWNRISTLAALNIDFVTFHGASGTPGSATPRIFVGVADPGPSVWESLDGGQTWNPVADQPMGLMALREATTDDRMILTYANAVGPNDATAGAVWRYDLTSGSWSDISPPQGEYGFSGISIAADDPDHLVVSTLDRWYPLDELFHSIDGGRSWQPLLQTAQWNYDEFPYTMASTPHWLADVKFDPGDADRLSFVTGYGVWTCTSLAAPPVQCVFDDAGLEETVPLQLVSPPDGAPLLSAMGDLDGFRHDDLEASPTQGRYAPSVGTTLAIAFAEALPTTLVKAHNAAPFGSLSQDGGTTWSAFATSPVGASAGGTRSIAISADGTHLVWSPPGAAVSVSNDGGATWTPVSGDVPSGTPPVACRLDPHRFYAFDALTGRVFASTNDGVGFAVTAMGLPSLPDWALASAHLTAVPGVAEHVWVTTGDGGLHRSTDGASSFTAVPTVTAAHAIGMGQASPAGTYPAIFVVGTIDGVPGIYRSDDEGGVWQRIDDDAHRFGWIHDLTGDPRRYGRVYVATEGRGIVYRDL